MNVFTKSRIFFALFALTVALSVVSIVAVSFKAGTDSRQDASIRNVNIEVDAVTRQRVIDIEKQQGINKALNASQSREIKRNRDLFVSILKFRDQNPELFYGIDLPTTDGCIEETESDGRPPSEPSPLQPFAHPVS